MPRNQNAIDLSVSASTDGFTIGGGATERELTVKGGDLTLEGGTGNTFDFPPSSDTLVGEDSTQTLTNKTITGSFTGSGKIYEAESSSYAETASYAEGAGIGSGTPNYLTKWDGAGTAIDNSSVYQDADRVYVFGNPSGRAHDKLRISGSINVGGSVESSTAVLTSHAGHMLSGFIIGNQFATVSGTEYGLTATRNVVLPTINRLEAAPVRYTVSSSGIYETPTLAFDTNWERSGKIATGSVGQWTIDLFPQLVYGVDNATGFIYSEGTFIVSIYWDAAVSTLPSGLLHLEYFQYVAGSGVDQWTTVYSGSFDKSPYAFQAASGNYVKKLRVTVDNSDTSPSNKETWINHIGWYPARSSVSEDAAAADRPTQIPAFSELNQEASWPQLTIYDSNYSQSIVLDADNSDISSSTLHLSALDALFISGANVLAAIGGDTYLKAPNTIILQPAGGVVQPSADNQINLGYPSTSFANVYGRTIHASESILMGPNSSIIVSESQIIATDGTALYFGSPSKGGDSNIVIQNWAKRLYPASASYTDLGIENQPWRSIWANAFNASQSIKIDRRHEASTGFVSLFVQPDQDSGITWYSGSIPRWAIYRSGGAGILSFAHYDSAGAWSGSAFYLHQDTKYATFSDRIQWGGGPFILSSADVLTTTDITPAVHVSASSAQSYQVVGTKFTGYQSASQSDSGSNQSYPEIGGFVAPAMGNVPSQYPFMYMYNGSGLHMAHKQPGVTVSFVSGSGSGDPNNLFDTIGDNQIELWGLNAGGDVIIEVDGLDILGGTANNAWFGAVQPHGPGNFDYKLEVGIDINDLETVQEAIALTTRANVKYFTTSNGGSITKARMTFSNYPNPTYVKCVAIINRNSPQYWNWLSTAGGNVYGNVDFYTSSINLHWDGVGGEGKLNFKYNDGTWYDQLATLGTAYFRRRDASPGNWYWRGANNYDQMRLNDAGLTWGAGASPIYIKSSSLVAQLSSSTPFAATQYFNEDVYLNTSPGDSTQLWLNSEPTQDARIWFTHNGDAKWLLYSTNANTFRLALYEPSGTWTGKGFSLDGTTGDMIISEDLDVQGSCTASAFKGDGSQLTNVSDGMTWNPITADLTASVGTGYLSSGSALITVHLPTTSAVGSRIRIAGANTGGWKLTQNAGQQIHFGNVSSSVGFAGNVASTHWRDSIEAVCVITDAEWQIISSVGVIDVN